MKPKRTTIMSDVTSNPKTKAQPASPCHRDAEVRDPAFRYAEVRDAEDGSTGRVPRFAEKSVTQAKDNWEKMKAATEEATDMIEDSYATASKGGADYGLKMIEAARANTNAGFDYAGQLFTAKSPAEVVEISTAHMQFDEFDDRAEQGARPALAQKVAADTTEPIKESMSSAFKKAGDASRAGAPRLQFAQPGTLVRAFR